MYVQDVYVIKLHFTRQWNSFCCEKKLKLASSEARERKVRDTKTIFLP